MATDFTLPVGNAGQLADMVPSTLISRTVEDSAGISFGLPVKQGTNDNGCAAGVAANDFLGITVREAGRDGFAQYESARLITQGTIWLTAAGAISAGDRVMTDGSTWKTDATGSTSDFTLDEAVAETSADDGGLFKLRIWGTNVTAQTA